MTRNDLKAPVRRAIEIGTQLICQFKERAYADPSITNELFNELCAAVSALPSGILGRGFHENLQDWPKMWKLGEFNAAMYQMGLLIRKLQHREHNWNATVPIDLSVLRPVQRQTRSLAESGGL